MAIKCILVNVDNVLISEVEEVMAEEGEPDCKLINPYRFFDEENMKPWVQASNQTEYMLRSEDILTIADPSPEVVQKYKELTT
tara:strand:- start:24 stop:272 length:249 start_codon:yes stop_codon:yes gene_type:complete